MLSLYPLHERTRRACGFIDVHGHHVFRPALGPSSFVVDAGAHRGAFSRALLAEVGCRIVALEPNPELVGGADLPPGLTWIEAALSTRDGDGVLRVGPNPEASSLRSDLLAAEQDLKEIRVAVVSIESLMQRFDRSVIDLLKLDVEGAEIEILMQLSPETARAIRQISVEFHSFLGGEAEKRNVQAVRKRLESLGFVRLHGSAPAPHEVDTLFLNVAALRLPLRVRAYLALGEPIFDVLRRVLGGLRRRLRALGPERERRAA